MPTVVNGIGTWYYGKRRIHTLKGTCEFCGRNADLVSYDTTLFFVVIFVPIIPLGQKRILQQCSVCQQHRVISLADWEDAKEDDGAQLLEKLRANPDDREAILQAIRFSLAYQDEPLFSSVVETLAGERTGDAPLQLLLGDGFSYFARWPEAEQAYRASLAVEDNEIVREQLGWTLLKQHLPDEARPYLQHILERKKIEAAGMIYFLIKGFQAQGNHDEALALMDERDRAFPEYVAIKEYKRQRALSTRYRGTDKRIRSDTLDEKGQAGYREGGWTSRFPRWIAASVVLGLLALYVGSAIWIGQARKVYLVNGAGRPYQVMIAGQQHTLPPNSALPIRIPEGDVEVSFPDAKPALEPVKAHIESSFWSRPFAGHTFVLNPDQSAVIVEEETFYAKANPPPGMPPAIHFGQASYSLPGVDYEFQEFPHSIQVKGGSQIRKTRVALAPSLAAELRLNLLQRLDPQEQIKFCKRLLQIDPGNVLFLYWLSTRITPQELLKFIETRLDDRPTLVEWHRVYQSHMERTHPETDLRPRYRKLLADTNGHADAVYLLARIDPDPDESDKLLKQAASAKPPSGNAIYGLGFRALSEGRFAEASQLFERALPMLSEKLFAKKFYHDALLASGDFDKLLKLLRSESQLPGGKVSALTQMVRVYAIRGDADQARKTLAEVVQLSPPQDRPAAQQLFETLLCLCSNDKDGYVTTAAQTPTFEAALLRGKLAEAADLAGISNPDSDSFHGLLYLEATRTKAKDLAQSQWQALVDDLKKRGREEQLLGDILAGKKPFDARLVQRLPIEPTSKRVLLAVAAQRYPDHAKELLALARRLNFQRDAISLCLEKVLAQP